MTSQEGDARRYHERTKHSPESVRADSHSLDFENKPTPYKVYEDLPTVSLERRLRPPQVPALAAVTGDLPETRTAVDREALTELCYYSAGVTKAIERGGRELLFRAAACTGALYHVDLYLVCGDLADLDAGVYHFDPTTLSLDVVREGDHRGALVEAAGDEPAVARAPLTVVTTSTWWRNAWKYRERTYRHAFWDSGTMLANLLATASALGLPARVVTGFADERVADLLGVDVAREAPLELVPVGRTSDAAPDAPAVTPLDPATRPLSEHEREFALIEAAYRASSLPDGEAAAAWRADASPGIGLRDAGDGERVALDPVSDARAAKTPLHATVRRRGSCRAYERETLNGRKVATVLDRAFRGFPADVREPAGPAARGEADREDGPALQYTDCYLLVHDVAGVPSGSYHYHPDAGELELLRAGEFRREAGHLALDQRLAADAGLCAFFLADVDALVERLGSRGYRVAQLEAAITAGRLYLGAYAHRDLGATGLTFYDDAVTEFFAPRAEGQTPMFLWTLGRPA